MITVSKRLSVGLSLAVLLSLIAAVVPAAARSYPVVDFTAEPTSGYAPLVVQFDDVSSQPEPASFFSIDSFVGLLNTTEECYLDQTWDFGDGTTASNTTPMEYHFDQFDVAHTYTEPGTYTVSLTYEGVCPSLDSFVSVPWWNPNASQDQTNDQTMTKELYIRVLEPKKEYEKRLEPAKMSVAYLNIDPMQVLPNQEVIVSANVCNQGEEDGTKTATLMVNGNAEQSQSVGVSGGACKQVVFRTFQPIPGTYQVSIDGMTGQFSVLAPRTVTNNVPSQQATGLGTAGILAIVVVGIVLIIALVVILKKE
ncbi:MAG: PKD domain-containing protein [Dehalococcoidia bacterium]|nr:PKD domain-containing protein [Dehalococcoidia bacterium]